MFHEKELLETEPRTSPKFGVRGTPGRKLLPKKSALVHVACPVRALGLSYDGGLVGLGWPSTAVLYSSASRFHFFCRNILPEEPGRFDQTIVSGIF